MGTDNVHENVLRRIKRGLSGYVSYLAACDMNSSFSEYVLYEPILRILTAQGYDVTCEWSVPDGSQRRIDFVANKGGTSFAMEVKWKKELAQSVVKDHEKLQYYMNNNPGSFGFLCVFGRMSELQILALDVPDFQEYGDPVYVDVAQTRYGCRVFWYG